MSLVQVTIDGRSIPVEPGTTVLEAARQGGITIPTLCHVKDIDPSASCFLCCVQVEGRPNLSPACALPVADGMSVVTDSDDVREARKMALELLLSDHAGDCIAPCSAGCPAGLDIPGFTFEIARHQPHRAAAVIADRLFLPGALGRVCPRLCERDCRRCGHDEGLAIGALHRYAADRDLASREPFVPDQAPPSGRRVAIVGAGPAGLAAAYYLAQRGHACTIHDAHPEPGGMLRYGIPEYRLPKRDLDAEVAVLRTLGVTFRMGQRLGRDFTLGDLRHRADAVFLALGAQQAQGLRCEGEALAVSGIGFLEEVAKGHAPPLGERVAVIGGGNTAMDAARTALRLGARTVTVLYRRSREEMPCLLEEVEGAEQEGIAFEFFTAPVRLAQNGDQGLELTCQEMRPGEPDESGRRRPVPVAGSETVRRFDSVIAAIGQSVVTEVAAREGIEVTSWGIQVHPRTLATNLPGVFAGGDAVSGPDLAVHAVAAGRTAAISIDQHLSGATVTGPREFSNILLKAPGEQERAALFREIERRGRVDLPELDLAARRTTFQEVQGGLTDAAALEEARRCLSCGCRKVEGCGVRQLASEHGADPYRFLGERRQFSQDLSHPDIIYEPGKCILCEACVKVAEQEGEALGVSVLGRGFQVAVGVPFDRPLSEGLARAARRAAELCPTGAMALRSERACDLAHCSVALLGLTRPGCPPQADA